VGDMKNEEVGMWNWDSSANMDCMAVDLVFGKEENTRHLDNSSAGAEGGEAAAAAAAVAAVAEALLGCSASIRHLSG